MPTMTSSRQKNLLQCSFSVLTVSNDSLLHCRHSGSVTLLHQEYKQLSMTSNLLIHKIKVSASKLSYWGVESIEAFLGMYLALSV